MLPLEHVRVVELGGGLPASYCTKLMADLGAEVIKVEDLGNPDVMRDVPPFTVTTDGSRVSGSFLYLNTSKKSLSLDLGSDESRSLLRDLVALSDLVVDSSRADDADSRWIRELLAGSGTGGLKQLVTVSISDFGRSGPYSAFLGSELVIDAMGGWIYGLGEADREPRKPPGAQGLMMAGVYAFVASIAALYQAANCGRGQVVEVSAIEAVLWSQINITTTYEYSGQVWERHGSRSAMSHPQGVYKCKDGLIGVNVLYYAEWDRFPEFIGRPELIDDERFRTPLDRAEHADELDAIINPWLQQFTRAEIYKLAQENKFPFALINNPEDLFESAQLRARDFWVTIPHPSLGDVIFPSTPFLMGGHRWGPRWAAPVLGQNNAEISDLTSVLAGNNGRIRRDDLDSKV